MRGINLRMPFVTCDAAVPVEPVTQACTYAFYLPLSHATGRYLHASGGRVISPFHVSPSRTMYRQW